MGAVSSKAKRKRYRKRQKPQVLVLGLDGAGKTTIVNYLNKGIFTNPPMTVSYNYTLLKKKGVHFVMWDIGGQERLRQTWRQYFFGMKALVFVIDVSNISRLNEAHHELHILAEDEVLKDTPMLILCNKVDAIKVSNDKSIEKDNTDDSDGEEGKEHKNKGVFDYKSPEEAVEAIRNAFYNCKGTYMGVSAKTGYGVPEALDWLVERL